MNPDSLRVAALLFKWPHDAGMTLDGFDSAEKFLDAHADAWKADIGMWKDAERHVDRLEAKNAALRQRLEVAEQTLGNLAAGDLRGAAREIAVNEAANIRAALASLPEVTP